MIYFYFMFIHEVVSTHVSAGTYGVQKMASNPLEWKSQVVMSLMFPPSLVFR